jgi:hypothetical protein
VTGRWFSPDPPVSSINKTDCHDIIEILLKVALNTNQRNKPIQMNLEIDSERRLRTNYMTKEMITIFLL